MVKKIIAILTIVIICISLVPFTSFGTTTTPITVTADKTKAVQGDIITFSVSYGAIEQTLGSSEFELVIPDGLEYVEKSCVLTNNLATVLGVEKAEFTESSLKFVSSMSNEGYSSIDELEILTFKCKVIANTGTKTVSINVNDFSSDGYYNYVDMPNKVIPATITIRNEITEITLNKDKITLEKGKGQIITAKVKPENAVDKSVTWTSSNENVAVIEGGIIKAISKGKAIITATAQNGLYAECEVNVTQPIEGIVLNESNIQLKENQTTKLTAIINPIDADGDRKITWTSNNSDVAIVDENGNVTAVGRGNAEILATTENNKVAKCNITVGIPLESISINGTNKEIRNGDSYTFKVSYTPSNTDASKELLWKSSDESVATVDENGNVKVNKCSGTAIITATSKINTSASATVTITALHKDSEFTYHPAKDSTCTETGNIEYYECSGCNKKYIDSKGSQEIANVIKPIDLNAHDWDDWKITKEPTCSENGKKERICKHNKEHKETQSIPKLTHSLVLVSEEESTCEKQGHISYYRCEYCKKCFKDSIGETEISIIDTLKKTLNHKLVKVEGKAATCVSEGQIEYWNCLECGKKFSDNEGKHEITNVTIHCNPDAHDWGDWNTEIEPTTKTIGKRTRICKNDPFHIETEYIYSIMEGDNQKYTNNDLTIKANGKIEDLVKLLVDENELSADYYTLKSGSTIAILNKDYLDTLEEGNHILTFVYTNGKIDATFQVEKEVVRNNNKQETTISSKNYDYTEQINYSTTNQTGSNAGETTRNSQISTTGEQSNNANGYVIQNLKKVAKKDTTNKENKNKNNNQEEIEDNDYNEDFEEIEDNNDINKEDVKELSTKSNNKIIIIVVFIVIVILFIIGIIIAIKYKSNEFKENEEVIKENDKEEVKDEEKVENKKEKNQEEK